MDQPPLPLLPLLLPLPLPLLPLLLPLPLLSSLRLSLRLMPLLLTH